MIITSCIVYRTKKLNCMFHLGIFLVCSVCVEMAAVLGFSFPCSPNEHAYKSSIDRLDFFFFFFLRRDRQT